MRSGLVTHKPQAQRTLKYQTSKGTLFTTGASRPQEYFPSCIRSDILGKQIEKNVAINPTGVHSSHRALSFNLERITKHPLYNFTEIIAYQTIENYILPLLPKAPLSIHNLHLRFKILRDCYHELKLESVPNNNGKRYFEIIGTSRVDYTFYPSGTVNTEVKCSNHPFRLENELDRTRIFIFFGQLRDRLTTFLRDKHERIVPDILDWYITECDLNRDITVSDALHATRLNLQIKHLDHLFRIYIKAMGKDTVCRLEESKCFKNRPAIDVINGIFNPNEEMERKLTQMDKKVDNSHELLMRIANCIDYDFSEK